MTEDPTSFFAFIAFTDLRIPPRQYQRGVSRMSETLSRGERAEVYDGDKKMEKETGISEGLCIPVILEWVSSGTVKCQWFSECKCVSLCGP